MHGTVRSTSPPPCFTSCFVSIDQKGPIPGTPVVVADWQEQGHGDGEASSTRPETGGSGCDHTQCSEDDGKTPSIEKEHVQAVYDTIAPHWLVPALRCATITQQAALRTSATVIAGIEKYVMRLGKMCVCRGADSR